MRLLTAQWMREIDSRAIEKVGIPSMVLMENAARGAARWFRECFPEDRYTHALILAGAGNNGGDGMAVARILRDWGVSVSVSLMADPSNLSSDSACQYRILDALGIPVQVSPNAEALKKWFLAAPRESTFLVDALLGTGITRPVTTGPLAEAIRAIQASGLPVAAVDIPSGLSESFLPAAGLCVQADCTATFHALKVAHLHPDGNEFCGCIRIVDIGIPETTGQETDGFFQITTPDLASSLAAPRHVSTHKKDFGHVLSVAGSAEKPGAGLLSAFAALRGGAGLSTLALPAGSAAAAGRFPEVMTLFWRQAQDVCADLERYDCIAVGPGLGTADPAGELVERIVKNTSAPLVLDADALNVLEGKLALLKAAAVPVVITPHPGEFSRLTGIPMQRILADRLGAARSVARENGIVVVLKGHHTVVASPEGRVWVNATGNPGMATAGSGDVLTGFMAAQIARHGKSLPLDKICAASVYLHGRAGDLASARLGETGMTAGDLLDELPAAFKGIHEDPGPFTVVR